MDQLTVHRAAYLTVHGWACDAEDSWRKPGVSRVELRAGTCGRGCNCHKLREESVEEFSLEDAYWIERDRQDAVREVLES